MLKHAFAIGQKLAFDEDFGFGVSPEQLGAQKNVGGLTGGLAGAGLGGLLGKYLGGRAAESFDLNPDTSKWVGGGLGALLGGGLGGYIGSHIPAARNPGAASATDDPQASPESALGVMPIALEDAYGLQGGGYGYEDPYAMYQYPEY